MSSPIDLTYSPLPILNTNQISGRLFNTSQTKIYNIGLFKYSLKDSLKLIYKTQSNENGKFHFDFIEKNKYVVIVTEGDVENIYQEIQKYNYGICTENYITVTNNDSIYTEIFIDNPIPRLEIKTGRLLSENFGEVTYSNGNIDKFYFSTTDNHTYPNHLQINYKNKDTIKVKSKLKNRLFSYYTNNYNLLNLTVNDSISPNLLSHSYNKDEYFLYFNEPISINKSMTKLAYFYNNDSIKVYIELLQDNPFNLKINQNIESENIFLLPYSITDLSNNFLSDSLFLLSINLKSDSLGYNYISYGKLSGIINNFKSEVMVEAKNKELDKVHYTKSINNKYLFDKLEPGEYDIKAFEILNKNDETIYFSGNIMPYSRAAKFAFHPEKIHIRARWEIEEIKINFINEE